MKDWLQRKQAVSSPPVGFRREQYERQMAWAAGTEAFQHRDPLYHINESFQMRFDAVGRKRAAELTGEEEEAQSPKGSAPEAGKEGDWPDPTDASKLFQRRNPETQGKLRRFSETAFQRGTLSGAVLQGTGTMMLFSCLKKTAGQSQPDGLRQRKLFERGPVLRNTPDYNEANFISNRGFVNSAVGIVLNALTNARNVVEEMQAQVQSGGTGASSTLRNMYPFLDDTRERELLETYREKQRTLSQEDPEGQAALQNALTHTEAAIAKKAQLKQELIDRLQFISRRAGEALEVFSEPDFPQRMSEALEDALSGAEPPPAEGGEPPEGEDDRGGEPPDPAGEDQQSGEAAEEEAGAEPGDDPGAPSEPEQ